MLPGVKPIGSEPLDRPPEIAEFREYRSNDVLAQAVSVGEKLRDGRLEAPHVELPTRILVGPSVALGVRVVPEATAEPDSESGREGIGS